MVTAELLKAIENFYRKDKEMEMEGEKESREEFLSLGKELKSLFPQWLVELLTSFPLNGLIRTMNAETDEERHLEFIGFERIQDEFYEAYPGFAVGPLGYICIAEDPTGSGDPYFINIHEGGNPPVYQIYHDMGEIGEEILEGKEKVVDRLSDLFS